MSKQTNIEPLALNLMMVVYGFSLTSVGALLPIFLREFSISPALGGAVAGAQGVGGIVTLFFGGWFADKIDKLRASAIMFGAYAFALCCSAFIGAYATLLIVFFCIGLTTRLLDTLVNARTADTAGADRTRRLSLLHAAFGIGALLGPLYFQFVSRMVNWRIALALLGFLAACIAVWFVFAVVRKTPRQTAAPRPKEKISAFSSLGPKPLGDPAVWLLIAAMALYGVHQTGITIWLPTFLISRFALDPAVANASLSLYWTAIVFGRIFASGLRSERAAVIILIQGMSVAGIAIAVGLLLNSVPAMFVAVAIAGFASGAVIPVLISVGCATHPEASGAVSSAFFITGSAVRIVVPSILGILIGVLGGPLGFGTTALVLFGAVGASGAALSSLKKRAGAKAA
ncbi:MAG: MFS transporter [Treponemataceae bacterium]